MSEEEKKDWSQGILTEQDLAFLSVCNELTDILTMYGSDEQIQMRVFDINNYLQSYCIPEGFALRMRTWEEKTNDQS